MATEANPFDKAEFAPNPPLRPAEPDHNTDVWYRGWECSWNADAACWGAEPWDAYRGGVDLDVPRTSARTWEGLLDEIDAEESE